LLAFGAVFVGVTNGSSALNLAAWLGLIFMLHGAHALPFVGTLLSL
jgi:hypothetical protein